MRSWKKIAVVAGTVMMVGAMPFVAGADESNDYNKSYLEMNSVQEMYTAYHGRINTIFNDAIKMRMSEDSVNDTSDDDAEQAEKCNNPNNVATACVFTKALYEYRGYEEALRNAKDTTSAIPLFKEEVEPESLSGVHIVAGAKATFITREIGDGTEDGRALRALDQSIAFYDNFASSYGMHMDNERLIKAVEVYNKNLSEVRTETYQLAPQFHNVTTDGGGCT